MTSVFQVHSDSGAVAPIPDGMYVTTAGIGRVDPRVRLSPQAVRPGDRVLLSGPIGDHVPTRDAVRGACELLGLDPLHIANEGQFLAVVAPVSAITRIPPRADHSASPLSLV